MVYLVAFDGTPLSRIALRRATSFAEMSGERLVVVSVLPADKPLAEEYDLVENDEYDPEAAAERLREEALDVAPDAEVRLERVDRYAGKGRIASEIRATAREADADIVFIGSDNAGRVVEPITSVGGSVASGIDYDVFIVRSS